jgi:hypothetical protein
LLFLTQEICSESVITKETGEKPDDFVNLLEHRHPNCLRIDEERLYVGDSLGLIHLYDIRVIIGIISHLLAKT